MRLIDANALRTQFEDIPPFIGMTGGCVQQYIDKAPTVDAIPLPCKLGDPVYIIVNLKNGNHSHIVERKCTGIHITEKVFGHRAEKASHYLVTNSDIGFAQHIPFSQFGKTVFFSRKEAESVFAERSNHETD